MKGGVLFIIFTFFLLQPVVAYDQHSTHPSLTYEMTQFFNAKNHDKALSVAQIQWLKQGAVEEDEPARWINHFYDPVHNVGWSGKHLGNLSQEDGYQLGGDIAPRHSIASVDWVTNQDYQSAYGRQYGNQTWQKAIKAYLDGDTKAAFIALGHVLHLVEDVTVPDHVRDDSHPGIEGDPGSPYENFAKTETDKGELQVAEELLRNGVGFKHLQSVNQAIKDEAVYTNAHFFSEDTINNEDFKSPNLNVLKYEKKSSFQGEGEFLVDNNIYVAVLLLKGHSKKLTIADPYVVLPSYRDHLFPEAVLTGASVINLFFQEVEKYKNNPDSLEAIVPDHNDSFLVALQQFPKRTIIKTCGISESTCKDIHNSVSGVVAMIKKTFDSTGAQFALFLNNVAGKNGVKGKLIENVSDTVAEEVAEVSSQIVEVAKAAEPVPHTNQIRPVQHLSEKINQNPEASVLGIKISNPVEIEPKYVQIDIVPSSSQAVYGGGIQGINQERSSAISTEILSNPVSVETLAEIATSIDPINSSVPDPVATSTISTSTLVPTSTAEEMVGDISPPAIPTVVVSNYTGLNTTTVEIVVTSTDEMSAIIYFDVEVSTNTINLDEVVTNTISSAVIFSGARGQGYYFRARARDMSGNTSQWSEFSPMTMVNLSEEVVVNEIAWAGTASDLSANEWFELYNNTDQDIDLSSWKILISGRQISTSKIINKIIAAHGYYLFERSSDNTVKEIAADAIFTGSLSNNGEKIEIIKPDGSQSDEVDASRGWFVGDTVKYRSMERIKTFSFGNDPAGWQSNQGFRETGRTANGGPIYGSPKRSNIGFINLNWDQDEDVRVLHAYNNPYILQYYTIPAGKKLIVEPGVVIKSYFNNASLKVLGSLEVRGTNEHKVFFTSGRDASFTDASNNITVGSWSSPLALSQDWQGIWFLPGSTGMLHGTVFRYAGARFVVPPMALPVSQALRADGAVIDIVDSELVENGSTALFLKDATTTISNTFFDKGERAIESENSNISIAHARFIHFSHQYGPLFIKDTWPLLDRVEYAENTVNMPYLENVTITNQDAVIGESENYLVNVLNVSSSASLHINQGVSVYLPIYGIINISGSLSAIGSSDLPISFLPFQTSSNWGNIRFNHSTSTLQFVNIMQGNRLNGRPENLNGMIIANDSHLFFSNVRMWDSEANTMQANNSVISVTESTIGASIKNSNTRGIKFLTGALNLNNVFFNNLGIGVESGASDTPQLILDIENMSSSSFSNVDYFWQPLNLWPLPFTPSAAI